MMMTTGVDAAGDIDENLANVDLTFQTGEALGDALRYRDRTRVGERAEVQARASDDVGDQADIGRAQTRLY